ncbi:MAG: phospholipase D-like domain-containing protein [Bacteroidota bacterium]
MKKIIFFCCFISFCGLVCGQTIAELQGTGDATPFMDQSVSTSGIVTAVAGQGYFIQDGTAIRSGIYVYDPNNSNPPTVGDAIDITATITEFHDLTELKDVTALEITSSGNPLPEAIELGTAAAKNEDYEGMLIRISATCSSTDIGFGEWELNDGSGPFPVDDLMFLFTPMLNTAYVVTEPLYYSFSAYKIVPRSAEDVVIDIPLYFTEQPKEASISQNSLIIEWTTNEPAMALVEYGTSPDLILGEVEVNVMSANHIIVLEGLDPGTVYYVRSTASNSEGTTPVSTRVMCTASTSSGKINTYFNHAVDHSVATGALAVSTAHIIDTIVYYIDQAQQTLDVTMFEIEDMAIVDAINAAHDRGVLVRYITDVEGNNAVLDNLHQDIGLLKGNSGSGIMHDKFMIIDREDTAHCWVMTGSMNHTEANLGWDYNNVICIQDQSLARAYTLEFEEMWGGTDALPTALNTKFGSEKSDNTPHCFNINGVAMELYFSPTDGTANKIKAAINSADNELAFALLVFTDNGLGNAIRDAHVEGIEVKGIIDYVESNGSEFNFLVNNGLNVIDYQNEDGSQWPDGPTLHHKYALIDYAGSDNPIVITGSHNWSASANSIHDENTLIIYDANLANIYFQEFNARFKELTTSIFTPEVKPLQVFPNPVSTILTIDVPESGTLFVRDLSGQVVVQKALGIGQSELNLKALPMGVYFLQLNDFVAKVVKQ